MEPRITDFEDGIQRIVRKIVSWQLQRVPIVCIQGNCNSGKTELISRLHDALGKSHRLLGFSGTINQVERYHQEIRDNITVLTNPKFYLIEDLVFPALFVYIHRYFNRLPDFGVKLTRELPCDDDFRSDLKYFHETMKTNCAKVKKPAFDLILYNPDAKDKKSPYL